MKTKSRRWKFVSLDEHQVLDWFIHAVSQWKKRPSFLDLPMIDGLPADATVHEVRQSPYRKTFDFLIESESFEEVPFGCEIPNWKGFPGIEYKTLELRTDVDRWREQNHIKAYAEHHSTADLDMRDRFGVDPAKEGSDKTVTTIRRFVDGRWQPEAGFVVGEEVEWSPDLQQTWRHGVIREIDLPNARITVKQDNTVYAIAYRDVRRPRLSTISGGGLDDCGDQTFSAGDHIKATSTEHGPDDCGPIIVKS